MESFTAILFLVIINVTLIHCGSGGTAAGVVAAGSEEEKFRDSDADSEQYFDLDKKTRDRAKLFDTEITWLEDRPENHHSLTFLMEVPRDEMVVDRSVCYQPGPDNIYLRYLEMPDIYEYEDKVHEIIDDINYIFDELMRRQHNEYYLKNLGWNLMTEYAIYKGGEYEKDRMNISGLLQELANINVVFRDYMPSVSERIQTLCEDMVHNLETMAYSVEIRAKFAHHAIIHTIVFKGSSIIAVEINTTVGWIFTGVYSTFKTYDLARLIRKSMNSYKARDPNNKYADQEHNWWGLNWVWLKDIVYSKFTIKVFTKWSGMFRSHAWSVKNDNNYVL